MDLTEQKQNNQRDFLVSFFCCVCPRFFVYCRMKNTERKPLKIRRKDDGELFELQPEGDYANLDLGDQSIMRWRLEHFPEKYFEYIYE